MCGRWIAGLTPLPLTVRVILASNLVHCHYPDDKKKLHLLISCGHLSIEHLCFEGDNYIACSNMTPLFLSARTVEGQPRLKQERAPTLSHRNSTKIMAAPAALSALAAVAQGAIPAHAQEATQKFILQGDLERTHLALERARVQGEDDRQKYVKGTDAVNARLDYQMICIGDLYETTEDYEGIERDNGEYIRHVEEHEANLVKDIEKMTSVLDEQGTDSLDVLGRVLEHTTPKDTEMNDRKKFLMRWFL